MLKGENRMIKKFASYYRPHLRLFIIDMSCSLVVAICDLFYPIIAKNIINDYVPNRNLQLLLTWAVVLLCIYLLKACLNYVIQYWGHIVGVRIQADMRHELFSHLQELPFNFFDSTKTGVIMSRMVNDLSEVSELAHHGPEDIFISTIMLIGSFLILSTINLPLTLIIFSVLPFLIFFAIKMRVRLNKAFTRTRITEAEVSANIETSVAGIRVSRAYTSEEYEIGKFDKTNSTFMASRANAYKAMGQFNSGTTLFMDILYLIVLVAGGLFYFNGYIDTGEFAAYLLYINMFLKPVQRLVAIFEQIQNGITGFTRFREIIDLESEKEAKDAIDVGTLKGVIEFKNVSFQYEGNDEDADNVSFVINDLDLKIAKGKTVALVGPSGGGKTTICHLIPRFYDIDEGTISIDKMDIRKMTLKSLRKNIGIVAQDVFLFNGTVKENIAYGDLGVSDEEIIEAAKKANIHDYIMTMSAGYDTAVGERGVKLSGGQKQRISLARVFLKNPSILILDEATSALDNATERQIQKSLEKLSEGRTSLIVAHRLSTIKNADEIIVITKEGISERGTHEELISKKGIYEGLYKYQFRG